MLSALSRYSSNVGNVSGAPAVRAACQRHSRAIASSINLSSVRHMPCSAGKAGRPDSPSRMSARNRVIGSSGSAPSATATQRATMPSTSSADVAR